MNPITLLRDLALKKVVGTLIRAGLASLGGVLVENGLAVGAEWDEMALRAAPVLAAVVLSLVEKALSRRATKVALEMPPGSTERDLRAELKAPASPYTPVVVLLLALPLTGCAARSAPPATPDQAKQAQLREVAKFAAATKRIGVLVEQLQDVEIAFHRAGRISREDHRVIHLSVQVAADTVIDALTRMQDVAASEDHRRQWATVAIAAIDRFVRDGLMPLADQQVRIELQLIATAVTTLLVTLQLTADAAPPAGAPRLASGAGTGWRAMDVTAWGSTPHGAPPTILGDSARTGWPARWRQNLPCEAAWRFVLDKPATAAAPIGGLVWLA